MRTFFKILKQINMKALILILTLTTAAAVLIAAVLKLKNDYLHEKCKELEKNT